MNVPKGFTLSELLIALAILGVIATFTIPKVLQSQQDTRYKAIGKEVAGMLAGAYAAYQKDYGIRAATRMDQFTPYMNYVALDTTAYEIDAYQTAGWTISCAGPGSACLHLHNGAVIQYYPGLRFDGTASTNAVYFLLDPDGKVTDGGAANGPGKSLVMFIYINGRIATHKDILPNTADNTALHQPNAALDPPWFSWD